MKATRKFLVFAMAAVLAMLLLHEVKTTRDVGFIGTVDAVVGMPRTPVSGAGVARRTTRRVVSRDVAATSAAASASAASAAAAADSAAAQAASAPPPPPAPPPASNSPVAIGTVVPQLPTGCQTVTVSNATYYDCGGAFYKAAFQGNNLVYVVVENPT